MPYIYAIKNRTTDLVYYGSTTRDLKARLREHRNTKRVITSKQITCCPTAYIELLEEVSIEDRYVRERWWIENNPCVNEHTPNRTEKESQSLNYLNHREERLGKAKEYYQTNQEERKAKAKEYYQVNREKKIAYAIAYKRANSRRRLLAREPPLDAL